MSGTDPDTQARASYGIDAPYVPSILATVGVVLIVAGVLVANNAWLWIVGAFFIAQALIYLHTTLRGKFRVWNRLLDELHLTGDEQLLDIGCGRGAVLLAAARRLPRGRTILTALDEAMRVLRPHGRLLIADIRTVKRYAEHLRDQQALDVTVRGLGPGFWFAGPWQATTAVTATKT